MRPLVPILDGRWSGGAQVTIRNLRLAAERFPTHVSLAPTEDGRPLVLRNVVGSRLLLSGDFVYMPGNAWPWHGPWGTAREALRKGALRAASLVALRRCSHLIPISESIPSPAPAPKPLHNVLDEGFEEALVAAAEDSVIPSEGALLSLGSLTTYRNLETLVRAHRAYRRAGGSLRLVLAGPALDHHVLRRLLASIADDPGVQLTARSLARPSILSAMRRAHATVLPSLVEASPVSVLESLVLSPQTLLSDIAGHRGIAGTLVPEPRFFTPADADELAELLRVAEEASPPGVPSSLASRSARDERRREWARRLAGIVDSMDG